MILTCEECQTRYLLGSGLLGADGRRVRCSHCGHEWFQEPEEGESFAETLAKADPIPDSVKPDVEDYEDRRPPVLPVYTDPATVQTKSGAAGYVLAAVVLLLAMGAGLVFSAGMVRLWPESYALYQALHIAPKLPGDGLVIDRVRAEVVAGERGLNILKVSGYALNKAEDKAEAEIPPLRVTLSRKGGEEIDSWLIAAPKEVLGYEEEVAFSTTYPAPPMDAAQVNVRLQPFARIVHVKRDGETAVADAGESRTEKDAHEDVHDPVAHGLPETQTHHDAPAAPQEHH